MASPRGSRTQVASLPIMVAWVSVETSISIASMPPFPLAMPEVDAEISAQTRNAICE